MLNKIMSNCNYTSIYVTIYRNRIILLDRKRPDKHNLIMCFRCTMLISLASYSYIVAIRFYVCECVFHSIKCQTTQLRIIFRTPGSCEIRFGSPLVGNREVESWVFMKKTQIRVKHLPITKQIEILLI